MRNEGPRCYSSRARPALWVRVLFLVPNLFQVQALGFGVGVFELLQLRSVLAPRPAQSVALNLGFGFHRAPLHLSRHHLP